MPGDWEAREFLEFHRYFYPAYDPAEERTLARLFGVRYEDRVGNLSAGELRRVQIVGALAAQPDVIIADEITAVLDILGRRRFLEALQERQRAHGVTVVLATNVPEGLQRFVDHVLLLHHGTQLEFERTSEFLRAEPDLASAAARRLEAHG